MDMLLFTDPANGMETLAPPGRSHTACGERLPGKLGFHSVCGFITEREQGLNQIQYDGDVGSIWVQGTRGAELCAYNISWS